MQDSNDATTPNATTLPDGFAPPPPPEYAPSLEYDRFKDGVVCWYVKRRTVNGKTASGKGRQDYSVHVFSDKDGEEFELWGSAALDAQLYSAKYGDQVYLKYDGKTRGGKGTIHNWTVGYGARA